MSVDTARLKHSMVPMIDEALEETGAVLEEVLQTVVAEFQIMRKFPDDVKAQLIIDLRNNYNTTATLPAILKSPDGYEPWLDKRKDNAWDQWSRFKYYLTTVKRWDPPVIRSLDDTSNRILDLLADPLCGKSFDRRGLVMGYVQSGKTANFTALINKAFDTGFKVVIVLSGLHNNLRSQTQLRLDEEILGATMYNKKPKLVGVGVLKGQPPGQPVTPLTLFGDQGDFSEKKASFPYKPPILLVVKKNKSILSNLLHYLRYQSRFVKSVEVEGKPHPVILDLPLLLIDDEADQATVNTSEIYDDDDTLIADYDPTSINGLIRDIFHTFDQRAYVGYTATPFANILIDRESYTDQHGHDLFPRNFIVGLPKPSNYCGPGQYFTPSDAPTQDKTSLIRKVKPDSGFMPAGHKKTFEPTVLPQDLNDSIYAYLIATAIRRLRGQMTKHSSMLVHVTRFAAVQHRVFGLIQDRVKAIHAEFKHGFGRTEHDDRMNQLYQVDFSITSKARPDGGATYDWDSVRTHILAVLDKLQMKEINGESSDVLNYSEHKEGLYVLAVGGDKLSRGLTLEDLTVSYYLRPSKMYDALMQMGRWFGYRDGYLDLCRIYTTNDLANDFYHVAAATEELREQLDDMAALDMTPDDYVLYITGHPYLKLTSPNKMRSALLVRVSYSAHLMQTRIFDNDKEFFAGNFRATESLVRRLGPPRSPRAAEPASVPDVMVAGTDHYWWHNVAADQILFYLEEYRTSSAASSVDAESIKDYILGRSREGELTSWTVVLVNTGSASDRKIAGLDLKSGVQRATKAGADYARDDLTIDIGVLTSGGHEWLDFTPVASAEAEKITTVPGDQENQKRGAVNRYAAARGLRNPQKGLLLLYPLATENGVLDKAKGTLGLTQQEIPIGIAISFPKSGKAESGRDKIANRSVAR